MVEITIELAKDESKMDTIIKAQL